MSGHEPSYFALAILAAWDQFPDLDALPHAHAVKGACILAAVLYGLYVNRSAA